MKTTVLTIAIAVALTAPAAAATKQKTKPADTMSEAQKTNDASWRLVKGSLPIWLPSWAQPIYQKTQSDQQQSTAKPKPAKKAKAAQQ